MVPIPSVYQYAQVDTPMAMESPAQSLLQETLSRSANPLLTSIRLGHSLEQTSSLQNRELIQRSIVVSISTVQRIF
jgi:hypothetical protein